MSDADEIQRLEKRKRKLQAKMRKANRKYADFLSRKKAKFLARRGKLVGKCRKLGMTDEDIDKLCSEEKVDGLCSEPEELTKTDDEQ